jgi:uncharacterized protein (TIGR00369 family)
MTTTALDPSPVYARVAASFARQGMMRHLDAQLRRVEPGLVEIWLPYSDKVTQQQGSFHGGVIGALADSAAGYAGLTLAPEGMEVVAAEYKINFLTNYRDGMLCAIGRVVKPGKRLIVTTAEVMHVDSAGKQGPCALMQQTLVPVPY